MKKSKIVVPTTSVDLSEPRFDEMATIVSARQVVPIAQARAAERRRKAFSVSLILLGAAACGAIVANHYLEVRAPMAVQPPLAQTEQSTANSPTLIQTTSSAPANNPQETVNNSHSDADSQGTMARADDRNETTKPVESATPEASRNSSQPSTQASPSPSTDQSGQDNAADPSKLTRKRRVHPVNPTAEMITKAEEKARRGAALIEGIMNSIGHP